MATILITSSLFIILIHLKNWGLRTPLLILKIICLIRGILLPMSFADSFPKEIIDKYISLNSLYTILNISLFSYFINSSKKE